MNVESIYRSNLLRHQELVLISWTWIKYYC